MPKVVVQPHKKSKKEKWSRLEGTNMLVSNFGRTSIVFQSSMNKPEK